MKAQMKALPGNIKVSLGKSMIEKYDYAKTVSAGHKTPSSKTVAITPKP